MGEDSILIVVDSIENLMEGFAINAKNKLKSRIEPLKFGMTTSHFFCLKNFAYLYLRVFAKLGKSSSQSKTKNLTLLTFSTIVINYSVCLLYIVHYEIFLLEY
jgi:hypothetical protein